VKAAWVGHDADKVLPTMQSFDHYIATEIRASPNFSYTQSTLEFDNAECCFSVQYDSS
jgi:hypothetical protein